MTTSLRERRRHQHTNSIARLVVQREQAFRRLALITQRLKDARDALKRLDRAPAPEPKLTPLPTPPNWIKPSDVDHGSHGDGLDIPDGLKRTPEQAKAHDAKVAAEIVAAKQQRERERKAAKSKVREATMKAKASGDTKRMPLTGKAALEYLKTGKRP